MVKLVLICQQCRGTGIVLARDCEGYHERFCGCASGRKLAVQANGDLTKAAGYRKRENYPPREENDLVMSRSCSRK